MRRNLGSKINWFVLSGLLLIILLTLGCFKSEVNEAPDNASPEKVTKSAPPVAQQQTKGVNPESSLTTEQELPEKLSRCSKQATVLGALVKPGSNRTFYCPDYLEEKPVCAYTEIDPPEEPKNIYKIQYKNECVLCVEAFGIDQRIQMGPKTLKLIGFTREPCPEEDTK